MKILGGTEVDWAAVDRERESGVLVEDFVSGEGRAGGWGVRGW